MSKEKFEEARKERVQEILNDDSLSKIEKLITIEEERLWGYATYIQSAFPKWEEEIKLLYEEAKGNRPYHEAMIDDIFDPSVTDYDKHAIVSYGNTLAGLIEEQDDIDEDEEDPEIVVMTTRGIKVELKKKYSEIIDAVFDFACKKEIVGFENDW